jgi:uncharacterized protein
MPLNARDVSVAVFARGLTNLKTLLKKGEAHAASNGTDPSALLDAQLAPGMHTLATQAHWAAEGARLGVERLLDEATTPPAGNDKTFADLYHRIDATIAWLAAVAPEALEAGLDRTITIEHRGGAMRFVGGQFLLEFAIPNFFFHVTTAYAILRHLGVPLTKGDFTGPVG